MGKQIVHDTDREAGMFDNKRDWFWLQEPEHSWDAQKLQLTCATESDFWQRTHYGFRRDNGHALLTPVQQDFSLIVRCHFKGNADYDQAGIMVRIDADNWIKASIEYENESFSRLGSVVTNLGYSDWATEDIPSTVHTMWYRVQGRGPDIFIETAEDGKSWEQMRITHLHAFKNNLAIGIYACSPKTGGCEVTFDHLSIGPNTWKKE